MSHLSRTSPGLSAPPCSHSRTSFPICVGGSMPITAGMQPARRRFLGIFSSLIWCYIVMCVHWDTRLRGGTYSSVPSTHSIEDSGVPFLRLSGVRSRNSVRECTIGGRSTRRLGIAFPLSHHVHITTEGDQRHTSGWADH
jgi:hypothetical protein